MSEHNQAFKVLDFDGMNMKVIFMGHSVDVRVTTRKISGHWVEMRGKQKWRNEHERQELHRVENGKFMPLGNYLLKRCILDWLDKNENE